MIALKTHVRPRNRRVSVLIPPDFPQSLYELILFPVEAADAPATPSGYDFSDLAGRLKWRGDAVAAQRAIRDEW